MARTRVKICGITSPEDAEAAVRAGADAVGVILAPSKRQVSITEAESVLAQVPPLVSRVGVFVDADQRFVEEAVERLGLNMVQYSGDETPEACASAPAPVMKTVFVGTAFEPQALEPYQGSVAAFLLDTLANGVRGGTGNSFAWEDVHDFPTWVPLFLAGGLSPLNVGAAIRVLRPYAVDVCSGVEERPGRKEHSKIDAFVAAVAAADLAAADAEVPTR